MENNVFDSIKIGLASPEQIRNRLGCGERSLSINCRLKAARPAASAFGLPGRTASWRRF